MWSLVFRPVVGWGVKIPASEIETIGSAASLATMIRCHCGFAARKSRIGLYLFQHFAVIFRLLVSRHVKIEDGCHWSLVWFGKEKGAHPPQHKNARQTLQLTPNTPTLQRGKCSLRLYFVAMSCVCLNRRFGFSGGRYLLIESWRSAQPLHIPPGGQSLMCITRLQIAQ